MQRHENIRKKNMIGSFLPAIHAIASVLIGCTANKAQAAAARAGVAAIARKKKNRSTVFRICSVILVE